MRRQKINVKTILRAPGQGLLTVSTGGVGKTLEAFYPESAIKSWTKYLGIRLNSFAKNPPPFFILGVPSDSGGGICRGAAHGPAHLRQEFFEENPAWIEYDLGDVPCIPQLVSDALLNEKQIRQCREDLFGSSSVKLPVSPLDLTAWIYQEIKKEFPSVPILVLGGDHSVAYPCFQALHALKQDKGLAVLHFDAHTDLLERRFGIDVCFGTWTAQALKHFPKPEAWVQLGIRASRHNKSHWQKKFKIKQYWANELVESDPNKFAAKLILKWRSLKCNKLYITHDIDGTDLFYAPATGTPENKGLDPEWIKTVLRAVSQAFPLVGSDLVEVAPVLGGADSIQKTLEVARGYVEALKWK